MVPAFSFISLLRRSRPCRVTTPWPWRRVQLAVQWTAPVRTGRRVHFYSHLSLHLPDLFVPGTLRLTACAGYASLAGPKSEHSQDGFHSPPEASSRNLCLGPALGDTSPSKPERASSTLVPLPRMIVAWTAGGPPFVELRKARRREWGRTGSGEKL